MPPTLSLSYSTKRRITHFPIRGLRIASDESSPALAPPLVRSFDAGPDLRCRPLTDGVTAGSWLRHRISRRLKGNLGNVVDLHGLPGGLIRCITDPLDETAPSRLPLLPDGSGRVHYRR